MPSVSAHIVIGNQDTDIAFFEKAHNTLNLNHRDRINTSKRFIQKNKAWIGRQGAGDFNSTTLTARGARAGLSRKPSICKLTQQSIEAFVDLSLAKRLASFIGL